MSRSKHGNIKVQLDGLTFDSRAEAEHYSYLKLLLQAEHIKDLEVHPRYEIQPAFEYRGRKIRKIEYVADFGYVEDGRYKVVDTKGHPTAMYKMKLKMFKYKYRDHKRMDFLEVKV